MPRKQPILICWFFFSLLEEFKSFALKHPEYAKIFTTYLDLQTCHVFPLPEEVQTAPSVASNKVSPESQEEGTSDKKVDWANVPSEEKRRGRAVHWPHCECVYQLMLFTIESFFFTKMTYFLPKVFFINLPVSSKLLSSHIVPDWLCWLRLSTVYFLMKFFSLLFIINKSISLTLHWSAINQHRMFSKCKQFSVVSHVIMYVFSSPFPFWKQGWECGKKLQGFVPPSLPA